jgi:hypothetical protein
METNLPISYSNVLLFIIFVVFFGQPEHVVLIHASLALSGSIVANHYYKDNMLADLYVHWVPLLLSLSMVDFSLIGLRQFIFAAMYPMLYLSFKVYKDENRNTQFQLVNPIKHIQEMYPDISLYIFMLYYVILGGIFVSM